MPAQSRLLDFVGAIYDCVIDPERWPVTLDRIRREFRMHNAGMGVISLPSGAATLQLQVGIPDRYAANVSEYADDIPGPWGGMARVADLPLEEPVIQSRLVDHTDPAWTENRYVREWLEPQGIIDGVLIVLALDPTIFASLTFGRHQSAGPIPDDVIDSFRVLAPHIRRAVAIGRLLDDATIKAMSFAAALDATPAAVVLVDSDLKVVHANKTAERMLNVGDPIALRNGKLALRHEIVAGLLEAGVAEANVDGADGRRGLGIPTRSQDGESVALHVLPLERRQSRDGIASRAVAAIFVSQKAAPPRLPADAVALLYQLTPAETRVAELLAEGETLAAIAGRLGSSPHTIRTHLNRVFDKTGCHRQADLIRLLSATQLTI